MMEDKNTAMMKVADLLKQHKVVMKKCPEIIEIIEDLYVEIEKQQIMDAYGKDRLCVNHDGCTYMMNAEQYYKETYNK
jgi:hypothetical protein